jgi:DNA-binding NarL/FixJ family response regulator
VTPIRVLVAEDVALYRSDIVTILGTAPDLEVVGEAPDGREALRLAERARPDVALIDLRMPVLGGVETIQRLGIAQPRCRCIVLTTFDDDKLVFDALRAGAVGYLLKDLTAEELVDSVRRVARGEAVLTPALTRRVIAELVRLGPSEPAATPALSPREREVLTLIGRGATNKEIAAALFLAEGTVKNHVTSLFEKLGVTDRTSAALVARDLRLL